MEYHKNVKLQEPSKEDNSQCSLIFFYLMGKKIDLSYMGYPRWLSITQSTQTYRKFASN